MYFFNFTNLISFYQKSYQTILIDIHLCSIFFFFVLILSIKKKMKWNEKSLKKNLKKNFSILKIDLFYFFYKLRN